MICCVVFPVDWGSKAAQGVIYLTHFKIKGSKRSHFKECTGADKKSMPSTRTNQSKFEYCG